MYIEGRGDICMYTTDRYIHTLAGILEVSGDVHIMYSMMYMYMNLST